jgi:hypothetical protein
MFLLEGRDWSSDVCSSDLSGFSSFLAGYGEGEGFLPFYRGLALFIFNIVYNSCL